MARRDASSAAELAPSATSASAGARDRGEGAKLDSFPVLIFAEYQKLIVLLWRLLLLLPWASDRIFGESKLVPGGVCGVGGSYMYI